MCASATYNVIHVQQLNCQIVTIYHDDDVCAIYAIITINHVQRSLRHNVIIIKCIFVTHYLSSYTL